MEWLVTGVGALLVAVVLQDVFHTLWHPSGWGRLSRAVMRSVWGLGRERARLAPVVGPLAVTAVVAVWGLVAVLGWTRVPAATWSTRCTSRW